MGLKWPGRRLIPGRGKRQRIAPYAQKQAGKEEGGKGHPLNYSGRILDWDTTVPYLQLEQYDCLERIQRALKAIEGLRKRRFY